MTLRTILVRLGSGFMFFLSSLMIALIVYPVTAISSMHTKIDRSMSLPDLIIESIQVTAPSPGIGSTKSEIQVTIKNIGTAPVSDFDIYLYINPTERPPTQTTPSTTHFTNGVNEIVPGASLAIWTISRVLTQTNTVIYGWIDHDNKVAESNEDNNIYVWRSLSLSAQPDIYEQDDDCIDSKPVTVNGAPEEHNLYREAELTDHDWVKIGVQKGNSYIAQVTGFSSDVNIVLNATTSCDTLPGPGSTNTLTIPAFLKDTTVYLHIENRDETYGPDNSYQLTIKTDERCTRFEPNDSCSTAAEIVANSSTLNSAFCTSEDADWFKVYVEAGTHYTFTASNTSNANVKMELYESCQDDVMQEGLQIPFVAAQKGAVYIKAQNKNKDKPGPEQTYSVKAEAHLIGDCDKDVYDQSASQDNSQQTAQSIVVDGSPQVHNFCPPGDADWISFVAAAGHRYTIETFDLASDADTTLCLFDATGNEIQCNDDSGAGLASRILLNSISNGNYTLRVKDHNPQVAGIRTTYKLQVLSTLCKNDAFEPDNNQQSATVLTTTSSVTIHTICTAGDNDWAMFSTEATIPYVIEATPIGPDADTILELYDASGHLLLQNDDFDEGVGSQLLFTPTLAANYYVHARLYNPSFFGEDTSYQLSIRKGSSISSSLPPEDYPEQANQPNDDSGIRTLIMVNPSQLRDLYGSETTDDLVSKLEELAHHELVKGIIVKIDEISEIQQGYAQWLPNMISEGGIGKANQVAESIKRTIEQYRQQHPYLKYLVIVGDDRVIPFYRMKDRVNFDQESTYPYINSQHPTGIALHDNWFLTDDFYGAQPAMQNGLEFFLPELAIGRLIETPSEMISFVDGFLGNPKPQIDRVLVTGWDFVKDVAEKDCQQWKQNLKDVNGEKINCQMIGDSWLQQDFRLLRFHSEPPYLIQNINGHATHVSDNLPDGAKVTALEIFSDSTVLTGGLIYSIGCHSGLNVPFENNDSMNGVPLDIDLAEAFIHKGANYIGNTGFGYGGISSLAYSERLAQLLTQELADYSFGIAWKRAKLRYYREATSPLDVFDQKVLQQFVYYGLPMYSEKSPRLDGTGDPFNGVNFEFEPLTLAEASSVRKGEISFVNGDFQLVEAETGSYVTLSGYAQGAANQAILPSYYHVIDTITNSVRSIVILSATYSITTGFDPVLLTPYNEYSLSSSELPLDKNGGWQPSIPVRIEPGDEGATLAVQVAQFNPSLDQLRQWNTMKLEILSNISSDNVPPKITVVNAVYDSKTDIISFKVGAADRAGIDRVLLSYYQENDIRSGVLQTIPLSFDPILHKWVGVVQGNERTPFEVQVVDKNDNMTVANNKGRMFTIAQSQNNVQDQIFLPFISR